MINLTERAAEVIKNILKENDEKYAYLRLVVLSGGCSCGGSKYGLYLDDKKEENDLAFESHGVKIITDPESYEKIKGSVIDYVKDEIYGEGFEIENPNEVSKSHSCRSKNKGNCGCN